MLKKFSQEFGAKSPSSTHGYSVLTISRLADTYWTKSKPRKGPTTGSKRLEKKKKGNAKKTIKKEKICVHAQTKMLLNGITVESVACR